MEYLFLLSGENIKLAAQEVLSLLNIKKYKLIRKLLFDDIEDSIDIDELTNRLALTKSIHKLLFQCNKKDLVNKIKGNVFVFFSSYKIRDSIYLSFMNECKKTIFLEDSKMSKEQKLEMLERFKKYKKSGAVLLGVTSGSFGEGIDMPGDLLNGVIIVGLPLGVPDLETRELIAYFDKKYKKGWDYGYLFPAFQKTLQNAGRCIRSENDKGVIAFLDERYKWGNYFKCFPKDKNFIVASNHSSYLDVFLAPSIVLSSIGRKMHALGNYYYWKNSFSSFFLDSLETFR